MNILFVVLGGLLVIVLLVGMSVFMAMGLGWRAMLGTWGITIAAVLVMTSASFMLSYGLGAFK